MSEPMPVKGTQEICPPHVFIFKRKLSTHRQCANCNLSEEYVNQVVGQPVQGKCLEVWKHNGTRLHARRGDCFEWTPLTAAPTAPPVDMVNDPCPDCEHKLGLHRMAGCNFKIAGAVKCPCTRPRWKLVAPESPAAPTGSTEEAKGEPHDEDCPCFGDIVEHSADCKNCTCGLKDRVPEKRDLPRRCYMDLWCPAEVAIGEAMDAVEAMSADVRLTNAVILLGQARASVADFIDGIDSVEARQDAARTPEENEN